MQTHEENELFEFLSKHFIILYVALRHINNHERSSNCITMMIENNLS